MKACKPILMVFGMLFLFLFLWDPYYRSATLESLYQVGQSVKEASPKVKLQPR